MLTQLNIYTSVNKLLIPFNVKYMNFHELLSKQFYTDIETSTSIFVRNKYSLYNMSSRRSYKYRTVMRAAPVRYICGCKIMLPIFTFGQIVNQIPCRLYNSLENIPMLPVSQIKKTLKNYGISFVDGYTCLIFDCPFCKEGCKSVSVQGKMYVNKTTGLFLCQECQNSNQWDILEKLLAFRKSKKLLSSKDLEPLKQKPIIEKEVIELWTQVQKTGTLLENLPETEQTSILKKFNLPNILSVIAQFEIWIDEARSTLHFPLYNTSRHVSGFKVLKYDMANEETVPSVGCSGLLTPHHVKGSKQDSAVIVPSMSDSLALVGQKMTCQVLCLPHGLTSLPLQVLPSLERYNKLVLWFGNDIGSWDAARNFAKKLDEKRCFFVRPTDKQPSPSLALSAGYDLRAIVSAAQPIWHQAITTFSSLRQDVLSELQNNDKVQGVKWKRFPALGRILKGHRRGEFTVLTGPTGSGKTTFMSEYSLDLAIQGVNTLWGSFEIRNARLARTMLQQMAGIPLDTHLDQFDYWADQFEQLPLYFMTFHGQQSVKVVMEAVEHAAYVHDIAHVIIDNVQFMMGVSEESRHVDRFWKQDAIVACFRTFATKQNCHVTLVIHPRKERDTEDLTTNSIFGSAKAAQEADNVLIIQDKRLTSVRGKKYLQVAKNRYSGDLGVMTLEFDKDSLSYGQRKKKSSREED